MRNLINTMWGMLAGVAVVIVLSVILTAVLLIPAVILMSEVGCGAKVLAILWFAAVAVYISGKELE